MGIYERVLCIASVITIIIIIEYIIASVDAKCLQIDILKDCVVL
jgi:hypothetical protein